MTDLKKVLTKAVTSETDAKVSKKSTGTKIASSQRVIPVIVIKPFSA